MLRLYLSREVDQLYLWKIIYVLGHHVGEQVGQDKVKAPSKASEEEHQIPSAERSRLLNIVPHLLMTRVPYGNDRHRPH